MRSRASLVMNRRCSCLPTRRYFCGNLFSLAAEIALPVTSSLLSTAYNVHAARPYVWLREFGPFEARPPKVQTTISAMGNGALALMSLQDSSLFYIGRPE